MGANEKCALLRSEWYISNKRVYTGSKPRFEEAYWTELPQPSHLVSIDNAASEREKETQQLVQYHSTPRTAGVISNNVCGINLIHQA